MGHDICIDENTGKASIFVVKEPAWHGLGQVVSFPNNPPPDTFRNPLPVYTEQCVE